MNSLILIAAAGFLAGTMNALAGGGSFVSLPALISVGVPATIANASSTVALFPGSAASIWAYRDGIGPVGPASVRALLWTSLIGGLLGAILLVTTPVTTFSLALPWLMLVAFVAIAFGPTFGAWLQQRIKINRSLMLMIQFVLGMYGGYFGGAVGIMMLATWGLLDRRGIKGLNPTRVVMTTACNSIAVVVFILAKSVSWRETLVMLVGATLGGYTGAMLGRRLSPKVTRISTLLLTLFVTIAFFAKTYF